MVECGAGSSFLDMLMCGVGNGFGGDWTVFALFLVIGLIFLAYTIKMPSVVALALGWALVYAMTIISGGSFIFDIAFSLLTVGMGITIMITLLKYGKQSRIYEVIKLL